MSDMNVPTQCSALFQQRFMLDDERGAWLTNSKASGSQLASSRILFAIQLQGSPDSAVC